MLKLKKDIYKYDKKGYTVIAEKMKVNRNGHLIWRFMLFGASGWCIGEKNCTVNNKEETAYLIIDRYIEGGRENV